MPSRKKRNLERAIHVLTSHLTEKHWDDSSWIKLAKLDENLYIYRDSPAIGFRLETGHRIEVEVRARGRSIDKESHFDGSEEIEKLVEWISVRGYAPDNSGEGPDQYYKWEATGNLVLKREDEYWQDGCPMLDAIDQILQDLVENH